MLFTTQATNSIKPTNKDYADVINHNAKIEMVHIKKSEIEKLDSLVKEIRNELENNDDSTPTEQKILTHNLKQLELQISQLKTEGNKLIEEATKIKSSISPEAAKSCSPAPSPFKRN